MENSGKPPTSISSDPPSVTELFHRVNSVIPDEQSIVSVPPEMAVADALELLTKHGFSQVPVVVGREVLGLFSYKTFSHAVITYSREATENRGGDPLELTVEDCMEPRPSFARVTDEFVEWFDVLDSCDSVLVGAPDRLQAIVTAMDILRYLYDVASPFVLIGEVERSLRALIHMAVDSHTLTVCACESLKDKYKPGKEPTQLDTMTFNDYIQIVSNGRGWPYFHPFLGGDRRRTLARLKQLGEIRNVIVHFRRAISVEEYETLAANRDWMLRKVRAAKARQEEQGQ